MATAPTSGLPPLAKLRNHSLETISIALVSLRALYFPPPPPKLSLPKRHLKSRIHDLSVPDSGYASAEEEEDDEQEIEVGVVPPIQGEDLDLDVLRSDHFEREYTIKWLTGFTARSDVWLAVAPSGPADNEDTRAEAIDAAASLLSAFAGDLEPETALTRTFSFPCTSTGGTLQVELNDAPLSSTDHTSVGLQSWASSIVLAERICANPEEFELGTKPRVLELGAGTGMLSIALSKLLPQSSIVATDYHPDVLSNLRSNLDNNTPSVTMHTLDWSEPRIDAPFDTSFDIILAADVIYHPLHAQWIKSCVEEYLARGPDSLFWLIIPMRSTGRHEGVGETVEQVFHGIGAGVPGELAILSKEAIARKDGVGRADEGSYVLFKIGWAG
jgi:predicted nicotinamide N-methyase